MPPASQGAAGAGHVWLVGMMGAGKSTVAGLVAERLGRPRLDLDERLAAEAGQSVAQLFSAEGEAAFRAREARLVAAVAHGEPSSVVATGGGAVLAPASRAAMEASGVVVWLRAGLDEVLPHLLAARGADAGQAAVRPLLDGGDPARRWLTIEAERRGLYAQASLTVDRRGRSAAEVAAAVLGHLEAWGPAPLAAPSDPAVPSVHVDLGERGYPVFLDAEAGSEARFAAHLGRRLPPGRARVALVSDENVAPLHLPRYRAALAARGYRVIDVVVPAGEASKSLARAEQVASRLVEGGLDRGAVVVALGGGVVGDLAGFVAATLFRGVALAQVPTTLLAMVDASVGGKTGVNLPAGKNLVGAFHQPSLVWADLPSLLTLPERDRRAGLGEVAKHALLEGEPALAALEAEAEAARAGHPATLARLVASSVRLKAQVVAADEREEHEAGGRALLNLGHTVGHALEGESLTTPSPLRHGEAVALGLVAAARVGAALAREAGEAGPVPSRAPGLEAQLEGRITRLLGRLGLDADLDAALARLPRWRARLGADKKRASDDLRYVVLGAPGAAHLVRLAPALLATLVDPVPSLRRPAIGSTPEATP